MTGNLIEQARAGDSEAFRALTEPHRRELEVHCYRMLGSLQDAEDMVQNTLLAAWRALDGFEERASIRTWLYRIATNQCLGALRSARRKRPATEVSIAENDLPEPTHYGDVVWLEPIPDHLLDFADTSVLGPEAAYEQREAISLAFVTALQLLPARQRAVLLLRDVLGYRTAEVSEMFCATAASVNSALKRARETVGARNRDRESPEPNSSSEQALVADFVRAYQAGDVAALVRLLTADVRVSMPPIPLEYHGLDAVAGFYAQVFRRRRYTLVATRANGQPAFGAYLTTGADPVRHAAGLLVLDLSGQRICGLTRFDNDVMPRFGLPRTLEV
ncbi:sigma-70 family RNA polymerase sigma factor [Mycolicibacterium aichiense]|uniref:RNA polymerase sigma factor n=1 Tax=Mycolicibacterium aichiense TaxID=1799 RepID=A0AAD1HL37_9MYCO|nr:sigma-70 family RNA polymerase sigma factor [Mycolicibacterium aichiense]MCV7018619.1 sigma-70 family RNA polymerase sigma factor [Mycolicibacterium aichiense]BBX07378.1 RNA polymerase sigma factor [Mycolicibacterium aichiense]STZ81192.1 RNA polymerase factor sigma-70 [Mycolicibacterium aichiense]